MSEYSWISARKKPPMDWSETSRMRLFWLISLQWHGRDSSLNLSVENALYALRCICEHSKDCFVLVERCSALINAAIYIPPAPTKKGKAS